ncbi:MAG: ParB/RepB/Spo0J family partition protein [Acidimicrobiaceae bacterium]|nr:ParB/RepB/Spo0J family partition protein [Acidimicrobiaceae bacterium]
MSRRSGLGRGLGALIPNEVVGDRNAALINIPVAAIRPNPHQPRVAFDEEALAGLTASIRQVGVLQPILVRSLEDGVYELIAGERRWRAAKRAGLPTIPALCRNVDEAAGMEQALVENLHRQDLNPLEEAAAFQQLIEDFGLTHEQLSNRIGKSRAAITNTLRLFQLTPPIQKMVAEGQLSASHARALLGTPDRSFQESLARRVVSEQLSVRAVEEAVKDRNELGGTLRTPVNEPETETARKTEKLRPPGVLELEDLLAAHLDTRVAVELGNKRGRVMIDFADLEDLERIYRAMTGSPPLG